MRIIDIDTVTRENPQGTRYSGDLFIYHGTWHDEDGYSFRLDTLYICFVEKGEHSFVFNSEKYSVKAGDLLICHPNDFFSELKFSKDYFGLTIYTELDFAARDIDSTVFQKCLRNLRYNPVVHLSENMNTLMGKYSELLRTRKVSCPETGISMTIEKICQAMISDIFNYVYENRTQTVVTQSRPLIIFNDFIDLLGSMRQKELDMEYYARKLSITPKYLSYICKSQSGKTAPEWIREYVMNDARRYIVGSDYSIKEIASHLGFSNFSFFCKTIKRYFGMTPLEMRNQPLRSKLSS